MATPTQERKARINSMNKMLKEETPKAAKELYKEAALNWGISKQTTDEYIDLLGYKVNENGEVVAE